MSSVLIYAAVFERLLADWAYRKELVAKHEKALAEKNKK